MVLKSKRVDYFDYLWETDRKLTKERRSLFCCCFWWSSWGRVAANTGIMCPAFMEFWLVGFFGLLAPASSVWVWLLADFIYFFSVLLLSLYRSELLTYIIFQVLELNCVPSKDVFKSWSPQTCECDLIFKDGLWRCNQI